MSDFDMNALEETNLALTKEVFNRISNHDADGICELLHEDAFIEFYGPDIIPYAGKYHGEKCRDFFTNIFSSVDINEFSPEEFICKNDNVVVVGKLHLTSMKTGKAIKTDFVHVITCKDGKWLVFRDFMNTFVAYQAFSE